jgi:amidase
MTTYHEWQQGVIPTTMAGNPALAVPVGFSAAGLPMGIQIAGPNHGEMGCLQIAHAYDEATGWTRKRLPALLA